MLLAFSLSPQKNDTSATLDLLRAVAAQMVCVGHAINISGVGYTFLPNVGVLLFFLLSGFVIAFTLWAKSRSHDYDILSFGIERVARIYTAFLPAFLLIAAADYLMQYAGAPLPGDPTDFRTFLGNLTMRQGMAGGWGVPTFGSAGHLTTLSLEFQIYFFVGAIFFLLRGRNALLCLLIAVLFSRMPLDWFASIPESGRSLFVAWLAGFSAYYIAASIQANLTVVASLGLLLTSWHWIAHRTANDYDLSNYPALALAFLSLVVLTQRTHILIDPVKRLIRLAADYSFSLFLIHMTVVKITMYAPASPAVRFVIAITVSNAIAVCLAYAFERHYRCVADHLKKTLRIRQASIRSE